MTCSMTWRFSLMSRFENLHCSVVSEIIFFVQGELIDRIERNVENAGVYVDHGNREMRKARIAKRTGQRVMLSISLKIYNDLLLQTKWVICCILSCCFCLILIAAAIAGVVAYVFLR